MRFPRRRREPPSTKLHVGAFDVAHDGWLNTDVTPHMAIARVPGLPRLLRRAGRLSDERWSAYQAGVFRRMHYLDLTGPLPYPDDGRIVRVGATTHSSRDSAASFSDRGYWHFVDNNRSFEKFGAYRVLDSAASLTGDGAPLPVEPGTMTLPPPKISVSNVALAKRCVSTVTPKEV